MPTYEIRCGGCGLYIGQVTFPDERTEEQMRMYNQGFLCDKCVETTRKKPQPDAVDEVLNNPDLFNKLMDRLRTTKEVK